MNLKHKTTLLVLSLLPMASTVSEAVIVARYQFTGHSLANSAAPVTGVTVSDFTLSTSMGDLTDNSAPANALRISGNDTSDTAALAFSQNKYLSFTVTVAEGYKMDLDILYMDTLATNAFARSYTRVFSSTVGTADTLQDAIYSFGRQSSGTDSAVVTNSVDFNGASTYLGSNVDNSDFNDLTGTVTFYFPWEDGSSAATRYTDIDNVVLEASVSAATVPEPGAAVLLGICGSTLLLRRRR